MELFECKWTEIPNAGDTINLAFVRDALGKTPVVAGSVVCRTALEFPLPNGFRAVPVTELG